MDESPRPAGPGRLRPEVAWTVVTDAPLKGLALAREPGVLLAWDASDHLLLIDGQGTRRAEARAPAPIVAADIADDGSLVAILTEGPHLLLLDAALAPLVDRPAPSGSLGVAIDPHGRYLALGSQLNRTHVFTRHARPAGEFAFLHPLSHLRFVADRPRLIGASALGSITAIDLSPGGAPGTLTFEETWRAQMPSKIGDLGITGDGGIILASCFIHGIQRFDSRGRNEGAYHLGGTATHAQPDFAGRTIAVATAEGDLGILNAAGNLRWKTSLGRGPVALVCDALGRFLVHGSSAGEITRVDLEAKAGATADARPAAARPARSAGSGGGRIVQPAWTAPVALSDEQAETAVLAVLDSPPRIGLMTNRGTLQIFTDAGADLGSSPVLSGVGRILRTAPGWIAAATDRQLLLYDARKNECDRLDVSLAELTHLAIRPDTYGLALVQERDRLARLSVAGRTVWKRELRQPVEDLAIGPDGLTAVSTEDGQLLIFDPAGEPAGSFRHATREPLALVAAPSGPAWITLSRSGQVLRGHDRDGLVLWETPVPFEGWQLHRAGPVVIAEAADGRVLACDPSGRILAQTRNPAAPGLFHEGPNGEPRRLARQGEHLICQDLGERVRWRAMAKDAIGPLAAARAGAAALLGRSLAWFPAPADAPIPMP
jgi:hypothetical protein